MKAIKHIIEEMVTDRAPKNDPQFKQPDELNDRKLAHSDVAASLGCCGL